MMKPELQARIDRMLNSGTPEGVRKGWESRRHGSPSGHKAFEGANLTAEDRKISDRAINRSVTAEINDKFASHSAARDAHAEAAAHYGALAENGGNNQYGKMARWHADKSTEHDAAMGRLAFKNSASHARIERLFNVWSDAARDASAEVRKGNAPSGSSTEYTTKGNYSWPSNSTESHIRGKAASFSSYAKSNPSKISHDNAAGAHRLAAAFLGENHPKYAYHTQKAEYHESQSKSYEKSPALENTARILNAWSDAARESALEVRQGKASGSCAANPNCVDQFRRATQATRDADAKPSAEAHEHAAQEHDKAQIAAHDSGDSASERFHQTMADSHRIKATIAKRSVSNSGTSEGVKKGWETRHGSSPTGYVQHPIAYTKDGQEHDAHLDVDYDYDRGENSPGGSNESVSVKSARDLATGEDVTAHLTPAHHATLEKAFWAKHAKDKRDSVDNASPTANWQSWLAKSHVPAPESASEANVALTNGHSVASEPAKAAIANSKPLAEYVAKRAEKMLNDMGEDEDVSNDVGAGGVGSGPSGPSSGPSVPASGPNIQGPNGRLGALSPSPMLGKFATGAGDAHKRAKRDEAKEELVNSLKEVAQKYHGYLPNFKGHFTQKEIENARTHLPKVKPGSLKNGTKKDVTIVNGISKGKKVGFVYNERRDFSKNKNGEMVGEWISPLPIDPATPKFK